MAAAIDDNEVWQGKLAVAQLVSDHAAERRPSHGAGGEATGRFGWTDGRILLDCAPGRRGFARAAGGWRSAAIRRFVIHQRADETGFQWRQ